MMHALYDSKIVHVILRDTRHDKYCNFVTTYVTQTHVTKCHNLCDLSQDLQIFSF